MTPSCASPCRPCISVMIATQIPSLPKLIHCNCNRIRAYRSPFGFTPIRYFSPSQWSTSIQFQFGRVWLPKSHHRFDFTSRSFSSHSTSTTAPVSESNSIPFSPSPSLSSIAASPSPSSSTTSHERDYPYSLSLLFIFTCGLLSYHHYSQNNKESQRQMKDGRSSAPSSSESSSCSSSCSSSVSIFPHQVGGHCIGSSFGGILSFHGNLLKPIDWNKKKGRCEVQFYSHLQNDLTPSNQILKRYTPQYYGTVTLNHTEGHIRPIRITPITRNSPSPSSSSSSCSPSCSSSIPSLSPSSSLDYLQLEDLTSRFSHPCILDLKVGSVTYDEESSPEKQWKEKHKYAHQGELGFRIVGYKRYDEEKKEYIVKDKVYGRSLDPGRVREVIQEFVGREDVKKEVVKQMRELEEWFENQKDYRFYASSLLVMYEGDSKRKRREGENEPVALVRMVDFGHVFGRAFQTDQLTTRPITETFTSERRDDNYLHGLKTILNILTNSHHSSSSSATEPAKGK